MKYVSFLSCIVFLCSACVSEDDTPAAVVTEDGRVVPVSQTFELEESSPGEDDTRRREQYPELPDAGTASHEPANGFWYRDAQDPQTQVYNDTCAFGEAQSQLTLVPGTDVNTTESTITFFSLLTEISPLLPPDVTLIVGPTNEPAVVGQRYFKQTCDYTSSFADCSGDQVLIDFSFFPFIQDARLVSSEERYVYFDYGQQSYRVFVHSTTQCEGAQCTHPAVQGAIVGRECTTTSMTRYRRTDAPVLVFNE